MQSQEVQVLKDCSQERNQTIKQFGSEIVDLKSHITKQGEDSSDLLSTVSALQTELTEKEESVQSPEARYRQVLRREHKLEQKENLVSEIIKEKERSLESEIKEQVRNDMFKLKGQVKSSQTALSEERQRCSELRVQLKNLGKEIKTLECENETLSACPHRIRRRIEEELI